MEVKLSKDKVRETLLTIVTGFVLLFIIFNYQWMLTTALVLGVLGLISYKINVWIHKIWFLIGDLIGRVTSKIILGAIYFIVLIPMAFISRIFRTDVMNIKKSSVTIFKDRNHNYQPQDFENMW